MTAINYDTEFLEDGHLIRPISIGLIRGDGTWYYAVVDDPDLITCALTFPWLAENVLPSLPLAYCEDRDGTRLWR
jgi:hypothetical protein